jgi:hypothetical protein
MEYKQLDIDKRKGNVRLRTVYDTDDSERYNHELKKYIGKGFTRDRKMRLIAEIPLNDLMRLGNAGDHDAIAGMYGDDAALKRLIRKNPGWRASEGSI